MISPEPPLSVTGGR